MELVAAHHGSNVMMNKLLANLHGVCLVGDV
jgi:hypothetical protein